MRSKGKETNHLCDVFEQKDIGIGMESVIPVRDPCVCVCLALDTWELNNFTWLGPAPTYAIKRWFDICHLLPN